MGPVSKERWSDWLAGRRVKVTKDSGSETGVGLSHAVVDEQDADIHSDRRSLDERQCFESEASGRHSVSDRRSLDERHKSATDTQPRLSEVMGRIDKMEALFEKFCSTVQPQSKHAVLHVHSSQSEEEELSESRSVFSSWDTKRNKRSLPSDVGPDDSISSVGKRSRLSESVRDDDSLVSAVSKVSASEPVDTQSTSTNLYLEIVRDMLSRLSISNGAVTEEKQPLFRSSRLVAAKARAVLPFSDEHKKIVNDIWATDPAHVKQYRKQVADRYQIVKSDFDSFLLTSTFDSELLQELRRSKLKFQKDKPSLPDRALAKVEGQIRKAEKASTVGMACAVSQSWLLHYLDNLIDSLESKLSDRVSDFGTFSAELGLVKIKSAILLAQDAAMDHLDLHARQAAHVKGARRSIWVSPTNWYEHIKSTVNALPVRGDGAMCGAELKSLLTEFRKADKSLAATERSSDSARQARKPKARDPAVNRRSSFSKNKDYSSNRWRSSGGFSRPGSGRGQRAFQPRTSSATSSSAVGQKRSG